MYTQIPTKAKDDILQWLCSNVPPEQPASYDWPRLLSETGVDEITADAILIGFVKAGLIDELNPSRGYKDLTLKVKAHDFLRQGGFAVMDALNEANIQKILLELEHLQKQLKPDQMDSVNKITAIASSLATVLAAFSDKN